MIILLGRRRLDLVYQTGMGGYAGLPLDSESRAPLVVRRGRARVKGCSSEDVTVLQTIIETGSPWRECWLLLPDCKGPAVDGRAIGAHP